MFCKSFILASFIAGAVFSGGSSFGADNSALPAAVATRLKAYYGDAPIQPLQGWAVNGVKIYHVNVTTKNGKTDAAITENGDILWAGNPVAAGSLPEAVTDIADNMFQNQPQSIELVDRTYYFVNMATGKGTYELQFDPTGKLMTLRSYAQVGQTIPTKGAQEMSQPLRHNLSAAAQADFAGATAKDVHRFQNAPGYYVVSLDKGGQPGWVVMGKMGDFYGSHIPVDQAQLPPPVKNVLDSDFKSANIKGVLKGAERFYHVIQKVGASTVALDVRLNGDVFNVESK